MEEKQREESLGEIVYSRTVPPVEAEYAPVPAWLGAKTIHALNEANINMLYRHQREALEAFTNGENVVISTGTSSGKSLVYQIPILDMLSSDEDGTAILIFPTKALTQDQFKSLIRLAPEFADRIFIYDGDTPRAARSAIKAKARVIFTNPDMIHAGILPYHPAWLDFFSHLRLIVIDEAHIYKGIFGAHVTNVLRRMKRVTAHYGTEPRYILCSATLSNAKELAEKLTGEPFTAVTRDTSGSGKKTIEFINPPIVNQEFELRAGAIVTAAKNARRLLEDVRQVLVFCQSRQSVESAVRRLRDYGVDAAGYRSGYLARERRAIEAGMKSGEARCIAATNALELGMDIGGIDAVISVGYPGTISALLQRQGRAGRRGSASKFQLIGSQTPTDQYIMSHPDFLYEKKIEPVLVDPDNLLILLQHLQCTLYELPFPAGETFGGLDAEETLDLLNYLVGEGAARFSGNTYYWLSGDNPQTSVSLRNAGLSRIAIVSPNQLTGKNEMIGEVDRSSAFWMVHEGAVYFHNGTSYHIKKLDLELNTAYAEKAELPYTTEAQKECHIDVDNILTTENRPNADIHTAEVTVTTKVVSFKRIANDNHQELDITPLDLPEETLQTTAFVIVLKEELREKLRGMRLWTADKNDYGRDWPVIREQILARDGYTCQVCHKTMAESVLHVHHVKPFRTFINKREANDPDNLITLCPDCHEAVEAKVRMRGGLAGFAAAFHQMAALFCECDPGDLEIITDPDCRDFEGRPTVFIHEITPGGFGLAQGIADRLDEINDAVIDLITKCKCQDGCPGCVGAAGENGVGGKAEALAIAEHVAEVSRE